MWDTSKQGYADGGKNLGPRQNSRCQEGDRNRVPQIQGIHKRMVRFQKLARNLFLTLHGHNVHRQQRQLSKFLMR
jgi:hypothetical protein